MAVSFQKMAVPCITACGLSPHTSAAVPHMKCDGAKCHTGVHLIVIVLHKFTWRTHTICHQNPVAKACHVISNLVVQKPYIFICDLYFLSSQPTDTDKHGELLYHEICYHVWPPPLPPPQQELCRGRLGANGPVAVGAFGMVTNCYVSWLLGWFCTQNTMRRD